MNNYPINYDIVKNRILENLDRIADNFSNNFGKNRKEWTIFFRQTKM